ncbi:hypothetical protein HMPREF9370_1427 [Neisseria wadsworthii 9715]|uniref:Uncharacterized protein n=2 Tax=Neisseria TaxID=482 RepID=G4CQR7_9NEIS|nr:hypothetical protein HMPREF9370_1427 [Neisseria wadsworthii 9715]
MRISKTVLLLIGLPIAALYWVQNTPGMEEKISKTFSRAELFEVKFKDKEKQKEYENNKVPLFQSSQSEKADKVQNKSEN